MSLLDSDVVRQREPLPRFIDIIDIGAAGADRGEKDERVRMGSAPGLEVKN